MHNNAIDIAIINMLNKIIRIIFLNFALAKIMQIK